MRRYGNIYNLLLLLFFPISASLNCRNIIINPVDVPEIVHDGFIIQDKYKGFDIRKSLDFINQKEPIIYRFLKQYVSRIQYSIYKTRSFPYYKTISISLFSLGRGSAYAASVIIHELYHVIFQNIRNNDGSQNRELNTFLINEQITVLKILKISKNEEEFLIYNLQMKFLKKFGNQKDIEYLRLKMEKIFSRNKRNGR